MTRIYAPIPFVFFNSNLWWRQLAAGRNLKFAPSRGNFGWTPCPRSTAVHSVALDRTPNLSIEGRTLYHWASAALDKVLAFVPAFGTSYGKQRNQGVVQAFAPDDPYVKNVFLPLMPTSFESRRAMFSSSFHVAQVFFWKAQKFSNAFVKLICTHRLLLFFSERLLAAFRN